MRSNNLSRRLISPPACHTEPYSRRAKQSTSSLDRWGSTPYAVKREGDCVHSALVIVQLTRDLQQHHCASRRSVLIACHRETAWEPGDQKRNPTHRARPSRYPSSYPPVSAFSASKRLP